MQFEHRAPPEHRTLRRLHLLHAWDLRLGSTGWAMRPARHPRQFRSCFGRWDKERQAVDDGRGALRAADAAPPKELLPPKAGVRAPQSWQGGFIVVDASRGTRLFPRPADEGKESTGAGKRTLLYHEA